MSHVYHYCLIANENGSTRYSSGSIVVAEKIQDSDDYDEIATAARNFAGMERESVVISLNLVS